MAKYSIDYVIVPQQACFWVEISILGSMDENGNDDAVEKLRM